MLKAIFAPRRLFLVRHMFMDATSTMRINQGWQTLFNALRNFAPVYKADTTAQACATLKKSNSIPILREAYHLAMDNVIELSPDELESAKKLPSFKAASDYQAFVLSLYAS